MRLIDADALLKAFYRELYNAILFGRIVKPLQELIKEASSVDAVPVVRCKDCVSWEAVDGDNYQTCELTGKGMDANGFCSNAERRNDETD